MKEYIWVMHYAFALPFTLQLLKNACISASSYKVSKVCDVFACIFAVDGYRPVSRVISCRFILYIQKVCPTWNQWYWLALLLQVSDKNITWHINLPSLLLKWVSLTILVEFALLILNWITFLIKNSLSKVSKNTWPEM